MTELEVLVAAIEEEAPDDPLAQLRAAALKKDELHALADDLLGHFVEAARASGATWSDVGDALGVSKQAAQQRHTGRPSAARRALGKLLPKLADGSFRRFTPRAREVVVGAQAAAIGFRHPEIDTEHLLLGLYSQPGSVAVVVLERLDVDAGEVAAAIIEAHPEGEAEVKGFVPYADGAKVVLEGSLGVAVRLGHNYIGTEHILLALLEVESGIAAEVLAAQGVTVEAAQAEVEEILQGLAP